MKKVIAFVRTSTYKQEIEEQRKELKGFIESYREFEDCHIDYIGFQGASAIKLDDQYNSIINEVYKRIEADKSIVAVFAWSIDRIGRDEEVLMHFKKFLVEHKVNLYIKNPNLVLLDADGNVNMGVELAFSLFATMSRQEMEQKKARFKRSKDANVKKGKFNGGRVKFGYGLDENGYFIIDEENSKIVKEIFEMYASKKYSLKTLHIELMKRGINKSVIFIQKMLSDRAYIGESTKARYMPIVSKKLFDEVQSVKEQNNIVAPKSYKHVFLASKLIVCPKCGRHFVRSSSHYCCWRYARKGHTPTPCDNSLSISYQIMDGLTWEVASVSEIKRLKSRGKEDIKRLQNEIRILKQKIAQVDKMLGKYNSKRDKLKYLFMEGDVTQDEYNDSKQKIMDEFGQSLDLRKQYEEEIKGLEQTIERLNNPNSSLQDFLNIYESVVSYQDEQRMYDIVHEQINFAKIERSEEYEKCIRITFFMNNHNIFEFYYFYLRQKTKLYTKDKDSNLVPYPECPIIRIGAHLFSIHTYNFAKTEYPQQYKEQIERVHLRAEAVIEAAKQDGTAGEAFALRSCRQWGDNDRVPLVTSRNQVLIIHR